MILGVLDYGVGNIANVLNSLLKIAPNNCKIKRISCINSVIGCDKILLPGVGAFSIAMENLKANGLDSIICEFAKSGKYMLGICLGMQLLFDSSEEFGNHNGLGLISGNIKRFNTANIESNMEKIPHIGWNKNHILQSSPILNGIDKDFYLYFVHSYHAICDSKYVLATCRHFYDFPSIVCKDNIFGIQPHPEKSHTNGLQILQNFLRL